MTLTAWPITSADELDFDPDFEAPTPRNFLFRTIEPIGDQVVRGVYNGHLAPEILDPWVFYQFMLAVHDHHSTSGTRFGQNWRHTICARRMAERLGASELASNFKVAEAALNHYGTELMDSFDSGDLFLGDQSEDVKHSIQYIFDDALTEKPFDFAFGEGSEDLDHEDRFFAPLAQWVAAEFPREVLPIKKDVKERLLQNHNWARDHIEGFERSYVSYYVGGIVFNMLDSLGLRFAKSGSWMQRKRVTVKPLTMRDGREIMSLRFRDGEMLVDPGSMEEMARVLSPAPEHWPGCENWFCMADRPFLQISLVARTVHDEAPGDPALRPLAYKE